MRYFITLFVFIFSFLAHAESREYEYCFDSLDGDKIMNFSKLSPVKFQDETYLLKDAGQVFLKNEEGKTIYSVPVELEFISMREKTLNNEKHDWLNFVFPTILDDRGAPLKLPFSFRFNMRCIKAEANTLNQTMCVNTQNSTLTLFFNNYEKNEVYLIERLMEEADIRMGFFGKMFSGKKIILGGDAARNERGIKVGSRTSVNGYSVSWDLSDNTLFEKNSQFCSDHAGYPTWYSKLK